MGSSESKQQEDNSFRNSGNFRRSIGGRSSSKSDDIEKNHLIINNLKTEIDIFEGNRTSARYKEFHEILTSISKKLQQIKSKTGKQQNRERCDEVLGEIQNCFQRLETRVNFVAQQEYSLDLATVESHSFINHSFNQKPALCNQSWVQDSPVTPNQPSFDLIQTTAHMESPPSSTHSSNQKPPPPALLNQKWAKDLPKPNNQRQPKFDSLKSFERLEQETHNLERETKRCVELEDHKQFKILEKKIEILYTDLEMIVVDDNTPLSERKIAIGRRLIKCNNQIKKAKKALDTKGSDYSSKQDGPAFSKPTKTDTGYIRERNDVYVDFDKIEGKLEELEVQALTFEGIKSDRKYKEVEQILESYWTKVYSADAFGTKEKNRKLNIIERIKNILQELRNRAEENEKQTEALKKLKNIEQDVQILKKKSEEFKGTNKDSTYLQLDQNLRALWANITGIEEPNEHVRRSKGKVANEIQEALKALPLGTKNRESKIYENTVNIRKNDTIAEPLVSTSSSTTKHATDEDILQIQLLNQVKEFQNHWNQLNHNLDVRTITRSEISKSIIDIFEKLIDEINKKRTALDRIEKRKSTGSLVVAKVINNTDLLTIKPTDYHHLQNSTFPDGHYQGNILKTSDNSHTNVTDSHKFQSSASVVSSYENHEIIKTAAPVPAVTYHRYNVTPDLLQKQIVASSVAKPLETEIKVQPQVKTIGEMQRVGTEAKALLQQIRQSSCVKNDPEYNSLQGKLEQCKRTLEKIEYNKRSDTIESNRRRASKTITEGFRALEEKGTSKPADEQEKAAAIRSSRAQEVMDIDAELQYFRQQIKNFTGVTKDRQYDKIKNGLTDCLTKLQIMDDMHMSKQDSIRHIQQYHQELETKLAENQAKVRVSEQNAIVKRQIYQDFRATVERVQKLKDQVERFSGVYEGLLYKQIEENLKNCTQKLNAIDAKDDEKLQSSKLQTNDKILKYLRVLEDKSTKSLIIDETPANGIMVDQTKHEQVIQNEQTAQDSSPLQKERQSYTAVQATEQVPSQQQRKSQIIDPNSPHYKINALRDKLVEIKDQTETFSGKFKDQHYQNIEVDMLNCLEELKLIDDRGHKSVIVSKEQYEEYIAKLMNYFEEKSKLQGDGTEVIQEESPAKEADVYTYPIQAKPSLQTFKVKDPMQELAATERRIIKLKSRIASFEGKPDDDAFREIHQTLTYETTKLDGLQAGNVAHVRELKRKLKQELLDCTELLEIKAKNCLVKSPEVQRQIEKIEEILKQVQEISKEVHVFVGVKNDKDFCYLDEVLIRLMIQLDNIDTGNNNLVKDERKKAIQLIQKTMNVLSDRAKPKDEAGSDLASTTV